MKFYKRAYFVVIIASVLYSCEKDITVDLPAPENTIVVEGYIEQGQNPYVILTRNSAYFDKVDSTYLQNALITNAEVTVSDGEKTVPLQIQLDLNRFPFLIYKTSEMIGEVGKKYDLRVKVNDTILTATTQIPEPVQLDSILFKPDQPYDSLGFIWFYFQDPDTLGNYYRIFTKVLGKDSLFLHPDASVADDQIINGQQVEYTTYYPYEGDFENTEGPQPGDEDFVPPFYFKVGESVILKLCSITAEHYLFWKTTEQQMMSGGNPFASPATVRTNIKGNGIGIWGSYAVAIDTININLN